MKKQIGYIGLGKMGSAMVARLQKKGWRVVSYDVNGKGTAQTLQELAERIAPPRFVWVMVPAGSPVDEVLEELVPHLRKGDLVVDGGNSFFGDSRKRARKLKNRGIFFLDVGVSGGPGTVRRGKPALMIGGERKAFQSTEPLFRAITSKQSYGHMGKSGAGHFVKMVHNGIEYGMMQAMAEGFSLMKKSAFGLDLTKVARMYNNGSVIESRLTGWLESGFKKYGQDVREAAGSVVHGGEGEWTVNTAKKFGVSMPAIQASVEFRMRSAKKPSYTGKILMMLRNQFGGHTIQ